MQVMPDIYKDKLPKDSGEQPFLDPVTNIQVGVHVLEEAIRWRGSLTGGLQHYAGDLVATVPAGMTLHAVNSALALERQWIPIDPPFSAEATIGGIVAANDNPASAVARNR